MEHRKTWRQRAAEQPFTVLLATVILVLIGATQMEATRFGNIVFAGAMTCVYLAGLFAHRNNRYVFHVAVLIAVLAIPVSWSVIFAESPSLNISQAIIIIVFCGMTAGMVLLAVVRFSRIQTSQAIVGAVCVYLLIGLTWAIIYQLIEMLDPDAFAFAARRVVDTGNGPHTSFSQMTYFSFVTLSTLGYGDITPRTTTAETACWIEATIGQLYLAILVARLVGIMPGRHGVEEKREEDSSSDQVSTG